MKKLVVMLAMALAAVVANAASVKWNAANIYASDGVSKFTGDITLHCVEDADFTSVVKANNGIVPATTVGVADNLAGTVANFYITFVDGGKMFTSANKSVAIVNSASTASVLNFGSMQSQTQDTSKWGGGDVPEPTSGLLLLVGGAMLALRRKQK